MIASLKSLAALSSVLGLIGAVGATTACNIADNSIQSCQDNCANMATLKCSDDNTKSQCNSDCDQATTDEISRWNDCAKKAACDPACRNHIAGFGRMGGGGSADSCSQACLKAATCGTITMDAATACASKCPTVAYGFQIACYIANDCTAIPAACGTPQQLGAP